MQRSVRHQFRSSSASWVSPPNAKHFGNINIRFHSLCILPDILHPAGGGGQVSWLLSMLSLVPPFNLLFVFILPRFLWFSFNFHIQLFISSYCSSSPFEVFLHNHTFCFSISFHCEISATSLAACTSGFRCECFVRFYSVSSSLLHIVRDSFWKEIISKPGKKAGKKVFYSPVSQLKWKTAAGWPV